MSKAISIESTNKVLSPHGGLVFFNDMVENLDFRERLRALLPKNGRKQFEKFKSLLLAFICGLDSIDDISVLREDALFSRLTDGACADSTMGDFLRAFSKRQTEQLNELLLETATQLRKNIAVDEDFIIYSSDSTPNEQSGKKMEGVEWNYKKLWCLDTLGVYDHHGFHCGMDVRPGATYSSQGNVLLLGNILGKTQKNIRKFFHGDSAFSNSDHYNTCINADCGFAMALKENVYGPLLKKDLDWKKTNLDFFGKKGCEISECSYTPEGLRGGRKSLRVVLIRTKLEEKQRDLFGERYRHYALVSNIGQHEKVPVMKKKKMRGKRGAIRKKAEGYEWMSATSENIVKFYRSRGNTENFIKEEKYGLDLKHYPCKKLSANKVFGLVGAMAYNLMRLSSFLISKRGCYSKKIRLTLLRRPCQVVSHARRLTLRFNREIAKEVRRNREHLKKMFSRISDTS